MTAYLRNYWYLAAWSHEIGDKPLARTFFDRPAVLFRTEAGKVAMLDDLCPHRFAALHRGRVLGEAIECPYHGLRFSPEGNCVHSPFSGKPPHAQQVRSYPVVETDGAIRSGLRTRPFPIWAKSARPPPPSSSACTTT